MLFTTEQVYCSFCELQGNLHEPRWVVEVIDPDQNIDQRLAGCDCCADEVFDLLKHQYPQGSDTGMYTVLRRFMETDRLLHFDALGED